MSLRALIVHSDSKSMQILARLFHDRGDITQEIDDLAQAAALLEASLPDLLLLDIHYPGGEWSISLSKPASASHS